ncbi:MAG: hypothetical protein MUO41_01540 [Methyloceanibacter sp.]|jgi:hypothetical protein|nr:hypothetical protein [Methyloceanibacter sp.]
MAAASAAMRISVETVEVRTRPIRPRPRVLFCACDGAARVYIDASSEDDARDLCEDLGFEFIGVCEE